LVPANRVYCERRSGIWGTVNTLFLRLGACLLVVTAGLAGGCSTVSNLAGLDHAGYQPNGGYVLLASEQQLDCRRLSDEFELGLKDLQQTRSQIASERNAVPTTLVSVYGRMFGGANGGLKSAMRYDQMESRVRALNQRLAAKRCHSVDVDARIMAFDLAPMSGAPTPTASSTAGSSTSQTGTAGLERDVDTLNSVVPAALKY
jgi:hypothetical protein